MSAARLTDLVYGHIGEPVYDVESHKWHFTRIPTIAKQISPLGQPTIILQPSIEDCNSENLQPAAHRRKNIKKLFQSFPELVPGISLLPRLGQVSEIVNEVVSRYDPTKSVLSAFGKAKTERVPYLKRRSKPADVPILAAVGGFAGEAVRLFRLEEEYTGWEEKEDICLRALNPVIKEQCWWFGNGSPIQQVCFGRVGGNTTSWLAIRYHGATTILQPFLHPDVVPPRPLHSSYSKKVLQSPSRLDSNPIITLPVGWTGGSPHADISFSIWNALQFAIIDQQGCWTTWELERPSPNSRTWTVKAGPKGKLTTAHSDGWGAISWAGDERTIVIARRKSFSVFNLGEPSKRLTAPDLQLSKSSDWILDMKISPSDDAHIFIVTSTRIFWLRIAPSDQSHGKEDGDSRALILLSWRHFRDESDTSLKLNVLNDERTTMVLLYSSLTSFSTIYTFGFSQSLAGFPQSLSDPYILPLDSKTSHSLPSEGKNEASDKSNSISSLDLQLIHYKSRAGQTESGLGSFYHTNGAKFFQLIIFYNDMSLYRCLYVGQPLKNIMQVEPPRVQHRAKTPKSFAGVIEDDFIVSDRYSTEDLKCLSPVSLSPAAADVEAVEIEHLSPDEDPWTLNFEWLDKQLRGFSPKSSEFGSGHTVTFEQCLDMIQSAMLEKVAVGNPGVESMLELLDSKIAIHDIEIASNMLHDFLVSIRDIAVSNESDNSTIIGDCVHISYLFTGQFWSELQSHTRKTPKNRLLSQIYDDLMAIWITSLPKTIPGRVRVMVEKDVRETAAQICLANLGIRLCSSSIQSEDINRQPILEHDGLLNLPLRRKSSFQNRSMQLEEKSPRRSLSLSPSSQISDHVDTSTASKPTILSLPTPETTPYLKSRSSATSLKETEDPSSQRLRALTHLTPQPLLPISVTNILRQWSVGTDPATFDWEATQQAINAETRSQDDELPAIRHPRKKTGQKKMKKPLPLTQAVTASSSQTAAVSSSQPPPVLNTPSGPTSVPELRGSNQITREHLIGSSQSEPKRLDNRSRNSSSKRGRKRPGF